MMSEKLDSYRQNTREQERIGSLFALVPEHGTSALDVGARDGYLAKKLAECFDSVIALDIEQPDIDHPRILPVKGDATCLGFPDNHFDVVLCAEVLEHIPSPGLEQACAEIARVVRSTVIIGVPYQQYLRCGRTTCQMCHRSNPPWGHVNCFDENRLRELFLGLSWVRSSFVGINSACTNGLSALLLDYAGNPFGTYERDECCVYCEQPIGLPGTRSLLQRIATRLAFILNTVQSFFVKPQPNWFHVLFTKPAGYHYHQSKSSVLAGLS